MASDIFNVQPPGWLVDIAKPIDASKLGTALGTALAGATNAAQNDVSFSEGLSQARSNQADPNWAIKMEAMKSRMLTERLQQLAAVSTLSIKNQESANFTADLPELNSYIQALAKDPNTPMPNFRSVQGNKLGLHAQSQASRGMAAKSYAQSQADFNRRVGNVIKYAPQFGQKLFVQPGSYASEDQYRILTTEAEPAANAERIKQEQAKLAAVMPVETILPSGTKILYNPKSGHFQILKDEKPVTLSPAQVNAEKLRLKHTIVKLRAEMVGVDDATKAKKLDQIKIWQKAINDLDNAIQQAPAVPAAPTAPQTTPSQDDPLGLLK